MEVNIREVAGIHVVELSGELDANTSPVAQQQILPLATEGARILLDMRGVTFMSSAGLRLLLLDVPPGGGAEGNRRARRTCRKICRTRCR